MVRGFPSGRVNALAAVTAGSCLPDSLWPRYRALRADAHGSDQDRNSGKEDQACCDRAQAKPAIVLQLR